eukprot:NODE_2882_length_1321_cov_69.332220_g2735_i0.p1 GENE.NODE_2882_length_1321_cov_69.332220_g2735_i0~~NODE_2882_length_1321_cov_69.332220_g2735_i0.p1  ORF type:complete len:208 (-),score=39.32 NODE_2882_length_1321_cov_69.332220_g2735_i0:697-1263(-)
MLRVQLPAEQWDDFDEIKRLSSKMMDSKDSPSSIRVVDMSYRYLACLHLAYFLNETLPENTLKPSVGDWIDSSDSPVAILTTLQGIFKFRRGGLSTKVMLLIGSFLVGNDLVPKTPMTPMTPMAPKTPMTPMYSPWPYSPLIVQAPFDRADKKRSAKPKMDMQVGRRGDRSPAVIWWSRTEDPRQSSC